MTPTLLGSSANESTTSFDSHAAPEPPSRVSNSRLTFEEICQQLRRHCGDTRYNEGFETFSAEDLDAFVDVFSNNLRLAVAQARRNHGLPPLSDIQPSMMQPAATATPKRAKPSVKIVETEERLPKSLRESMGLLRAGILVTKFSAKRGEPSRRFLIVQDIRALFRGEVMSVPHLCWSPSQTESITQKFPLPYLRAVASGPNVNMRRNVRDGRIVGTMGERLDDEQCCSLDFTDRTIDLAFADSTTCRRWIRALELVVERNLSSDV